ncbi:MAG: hypothetical protein WAK29_12665 [Terriglobales bacterium]
MLKNKEYVGLIVIAVIVSILCSGCGGGSSSSSISQAQAQAVTVQLSQAVGQALSSAFGASEPAGRDVHPSLATVVRDIGSPNVSNGCTPTGTGENCNWPIHFVAECPQGRVLGTITVAGDIEVTLNNSGSGSVSSQLTITPQSCTVSNLVINGDPDIAVAVNMSFADSAPVFPVTLTESGGISYGPNPSGSCQLNVNYTITSATSCSITGTACGQSVSGSC